MVECGRLRRPYPQGRKARRSAGAGADKVRTFDQPQDRQGPRARRSSQSAGPRPPSDRIASNSGYGNSALNQVESLRFSSPGKRHPRKGQADAVFRLLLGSAETTVAGVWPMKNKKVVVAGATGLVGNAALRHFGASPACEVVALSRRKPRDLHGATYVQVDLTDAAQCARAAAQLRGATHLVYAALHEAPNLVEGWRDERQIRTNDRMLRNQRAGLSSNN